MRKLKFDFNNLLSSNIGSRHGVTAAEIKAVLPLVRKAHLHLQKVMGDKASRLNLGLEWAKLPFQDKAVIRKIKQLGKEISRRSENVLFLGIGGSYLGLKAAQDALLLPYYNEFGALRKGRPKIYFEGNNLDPDTLAVLLKNLNPKKTSVVVISKSGETSETKAAFCVVEEWLKKGAGKLYGRQVIAITDPDSGSLRRRVLAEQAKDRLSFRSLPLLKGVGGRFSELNMGLLHLAVTGINIEEVLKGAAVMAKRCRQPDILRNPAYAYALLQYILYRKKGKKIAIMMPFSETLKSTADWYAQLLAESLGKKYRRKIKIIAGREIWEQDKRAIVNAGRSPMACRGTGDLHSLQQNNIEGENDKTITFIRVDKFKNDLRVGASGGILDGKYYGKLLSLAEEATEWALVREARPNCAILMPEVSPYYWGGLIFFFELATAFEGELLKINAFDQPGVEGYKNYMYHKLNKPGIPVGVRKEIKKHPLKKDRKFII